MYAHLNTTTNFTFLTGASHPQELVKRALELNYRALAITDECSLAGIVKAYSVYKAYKAATPESLRTFQLLIGSRFRLSNGQTLIVLAPDRAAYAELSGLITFARRRSPKGHYEIHMEDLPFRLKRCLILWLADGHAQPQKNADIAQRLQKSFKGRLWIGVAFNLAPGEQKNYQNLQTLGSQWGIPLTACGEALMHCQSRKPLQDVLWAIRENTSVQALGTILPSNAEAYLKPVAEIQALYPQELISESLLIAARCQFCLSELSYESPPELVPESLTASQYLRNLVDHGKQLRYPQGVPHAVEDLINKELALIQAEGYEYFFLTVYDIVQFAQRQNILYQGRGSAANSVVCYCLFITNISPQHIKVLFERFISKERKEPPDIDVDFEHERREEVIQYIYQKYGRERAALAATVITYRSRSAIRDVGKALGLDTSFIEHIAKSLAWWDRSKDLRERIENTTQHSSSRQTSARQNYLFFNLVQQILGFPRHLSQHVGGFVIAKNRVSDLVPMENAAMAERTIIQWDKDDLETMSLLKVDVLALGMLTALRKALNMISEYQPYIKSLQDIPDEDAATYEMLSRGDSVGVFQVESRAQMSMLPRLRPRTFYDLVIQIAIVRPGPIQGDMVNPYLKRRNNEEPIHYFNDQVKDVLESTLGVPIFQEQAIRLAMVAAGFSGGKADALRRAMASWGKDSTLHTFADEFIEGMRNNGYPLDFAERLFAQIKGFGGYGFPESHSASFALLCYFSSWIKCHHPAAFYCALLNSQPMGFYSPSQLVQDARRHNLTVLPVCINHSVYESTLEAETNRRQPWAIRLGFNRIKSCSEKTAKIIEQERRNGHYTSIRNLARRTTLDANELKLLAAADVLKPLSGNRHQSHWLAAGIEPHNKFLEKGEPVETERLKTLAPSLGKNIIDDYATTGLTLRPHPMALLRKTAPFNRCQKANELTRLRHGQFIQVAGLVTGRQRPGTAKGTVFITLEDETGNINVIVWRSTQQHFRNTMLDAKLLLVKGTLEISQSQIAPGYCVAHVACGNLMDLSKRLGNRLEVGSRDFH